MDHGKVSANKFQVLALLLGTLLCSSIILILTFFFLGSRLILTFCEDSHGISFMAQALKIFFFVFVIANIIKTLLTKKMHPFSKAFDDVMHHLVQAVDCR